MEYRPTHGYFDLTHRPKGMTKKKHTKIQELQMFLIGEAEKYKDPEARLANRFSYEKLQYYMTQLQYIIIRNWPHEILFTGE